MCEKQTTFFTVNCAGKIESPNQCEPLQFICGTFHEFRARTTGLLQDFNGQLFMQGHDPMLLVKDDRLEDFEKQTMRWWRECAQARRWI
jgi:hypothetical protein